MRRAAYDFVRERVSNVVLTPSPAAEREPPTKRCKVENDGLARSRLLPEHADSLVFINKNMDILC